jgi:squalene synthase HpnC
MISRSAYAQLRYSPMLLAGTVAGMVLTYLAPPLLALFSTGLPQGAGLAAWLLMAIAFQPMLRFYRVSPLWGLALPAIAAAYMLFTVQSAFAVWRGRGGQWKGRMQAMAGDASRATHDGQRPDGQHMTEAAAFASGKGHRDENFPVASLLVRRDARPPILAFYRFARAADDVADHPTAAPQEKLDSLARLEAGLLGASGGSPEGIALREVLQARGLSDHHALDLLEAFRRDVGKRRYADWAELMDYCRHSASPVGRFVLDVHGESSALWPANDALCNALQVINHLQDCAKDYRALDRVYLPMDVLAAHGTTPEALGAASASPGLRAAIQELAQRTSVLLVQSRLFSSQIADARLALEVGVIQALAESLIARLIRRDPLSQRVHHNGVETASLALRGASGVALGWVVRPLRQHPHRMRGR